MDSSITITSDFFLPITVHINSEKYENTFSDMTKIIKNMGELFTDFIKSDVKNKSSNTEIFLSLLRDVGFKISFSSEGINNKQCFRHVLQLESPSNK